MFVYGSIVLFVGVMAVIDTVCLSVCLYRQTEIR